MKRMWFALAATSVLLTACGGGGSDTPTPPPAAGSFTLNASPATVTIRAGQSGTSTINISRANLTAAVALAASAPAGVTATFASASVTGNSTDMTIAVGGTVAAGTYSITVNGTATGATAQSTTVQVIVTPAQTGSFTMSAAPNPISIAAGQSGTAQITLTRTNFTGDVTITATAPAGITATVTGSPAAGTSASVALAVASTVAAGNYTVTLNGSGTGVTAQSVTLGVTVTAAPTGSVTLAVAPTPISVAQGATSAPVTVTITRNNLTGPVNVAIEGLPTGVTASPATQEIAATATTATFTLTAAATANVGTATYAVRAFNATVNSLGTAAPQVTITAAAAGSFAISATPNPLTVTAGAAGGTVTVNIARTNFPGAVTIAATVTGGLTAAVTGSPVTGNSVTISVAAPANTPAGNQTLTITGSGTGATTQTITTTVTVQAGGGGGGGNTTFIFCDNLPVWFAFQDGTGAWTRVTPNGNRFSFTVNSARGGVAFTQGIGSSFDTQIFYGSRDELNLYSSAETCTTVGAGKTINGTITGFAPPSQASISMGGGFASPQAPGAFQLRNVESGPQDLFATRSTFNLMNFSIIPERIIIRRNQNIADGGSLAPLDFNGTEAFAPATANLTIGNLGNDTAFVNVSYTTVNSDGTSFFTGQPAGGATRQIFGVPAAQQQANEFHYVTIFAASRIGDLGSNFRGVFTYFRALQDRTVTLAGNFTTPNFAPVAGGPNGRLRITGTLNAPYTSALFTNFSQSNGAR
nr:hypothetical protein [Gemmatimonadaceae bacterium]